MWPGLARIAVVEHRGQRGRLARAGGADHQDQAALFHDHFGQHRRQAEGLEGRDVDRDVAHHQGRRTLLAEAGEPEVAGAGHVVGAVEFELLEELVHLLFGEDLAEQAHDGRRIHDGLD
jgi:hypothetical protein